MTRSLFLAGVAGLAILATPSLGQTPTSHAPGATQNTPLSNADAPANARFSMRAYLNAGDYAAASSLYAMDRNLDQGEFQERDRKSGRFRPPKMALVRFKKNRGSYRKQASFTISNEEQARQIAAVFESWYPKIDAATAEFVAAGGVAEDDDARGDDSESDA